MKPGATIVEPTSGNTGHRARAGGGGEGLPAHPDDAGRHVAWSAAACSNATARSWCSRPAIEGMTGAVFAAQELVQEAPGLLHAAAVRKPRQPGGPPPDDRPRDPRSDRRTRRRLRGRRGHRRHDHRRRAACSARRSASSVLHRRRRAGAIARAERRARRACTASRASAPASCRACWTATSTTRSSASKTRMRCQYTRRLAREEGMLVGISAGANVFAAAEGRRAAGRRARPSSPCICDTGERYLSVNM